MKKSVYQEVEEGLREMWCFDKLDHTTSAWFIELCQVMDKRLKELKDKKED